MASPTERWKSSGHFTEQNTFLKQMKDFGKRSVLFEDEFSTLARQHLKAMQLQQDLVQLQERERRAKQRNRQLLQQFEQAQSALEEIMTCNTTMKAIRMEYERYLEERAPRWQQQFKEKTKAAQTEQSMEKHLKPRLEEVEYPAPKVTADDSFLLQAGEQKTAAAEASSPPECSYNQDGCPHPFTQCSWLTHSQSRTSKFPIRGSYPPQSPALLSPPYIPHPHSFLVQPFSAFPPYPWSRKDPAVWASPQHGYPWLDGTSLGSRGYEEEPPELRGSQNVENSKRSSRSSHLSQELDIKPVRLSSRHSESSGSSRSPTLSTKGKRKTRGRVELSSSDMNSEESSRTSSVVASVAEFQLLDLSSDKSSFRRTQKSEGLTAASPRSDNEAEERNEKKRSGRQNGENQRCELESGSSSEGSMQVKEGKQRHGEELQNCRGEESEKDDKKIKNEAVGEEEKQSSGSWEQRNAKEEEIETNLSSGGEEKGQKSQEQENTDLEEEEDSSRKTTTEEEAGTAAEEEDQEEDAGTAAEEEDQEEDAGTAAEEEDQEEDAGTAAEEEDQEEEEGTAAEEEDQEEEPPEDFDDKKIKQHSSSQDEDEEEMESSEKNEEEESKSDEEGKTDSDDSIISPQNKRNKEKECQLVLVTPAEEGVLQSSTQMQTIPETAAEEEEDDEDDSKAPYDENAAESSDEDDVENVLAPQDRKQKDVSRVDLFRVTEDRRKTRSPDHNHQSDSDEFDHFYD